MIADEKNPSRRLHPHGQLTWGTAGSFINYDKVKGVPFELDPGPSNSNACAADEIPAPRKKLFEASTPDSKD